jgi:hypothetical protein
MYPIVGAHLGIGGWYIIMELKQFFSARLISNCLKKIKTFAAISQIFSGNFFMERISLSLKTNITSW